MTRGERGGTAVAEHNPAQGVDRRPGLRFLTCGSVDDGKSTLIGRLLFEQGGVFDDQLAALERDTRRHGTTGEAMDFALLVDGLEAEREQGITIDVAYRYFRTARRAFVVADTPGHEQYTRNMATGASNADLAVLLVDARKGLLTQTRRHAAIVALLGIRHVVLAVNKIDLVGFDERVFAEIEAAFHRFAAPLGFANVTAIPLAARHGDNLSVQSPRTPWYKGPSLLAHLEEVDVADASADRPFRMPVQWVNRPDGDFRGLAGTVAAGRVAPGDEVVVAVSGRTSRVKRVHTADGDVAEAHAGDAVTLVLADELDVARGDVLAAPQNPPFVAAGFAADLIWMGNEPLRLGFSYLVKVGARTVPATVAALDYRLDVSDLGQQGATTLRLNEIGRATLATTTPVAFELYADSPALGAFILIDRENNATIAAGLVRAAQRPERQVDRRPSPVARADRVRIKPHEPAIVWITGPSGAAGAALAGAVERRLNRAGVHTALLDEEALRIDRPVAPDGSKAERADGVRRLAGTARLMMDAGLVVLCAFPARKRAERDAARAKTVGEFIEVLVDVPPASADPQAYEAPSDPEVVVGRDGEALERSTEAVLAVLADRGIVPRTDGLSDWSI